MQWYSCARYKAPGPLVLMSLHVPKSIFFVRLLYPVGESAQGSNPKVAVEYSIKLLLEFSKTKGGKKSGGYVNIPLSPLTCSTPIWSLAHQSFRRIFVWFVSGDSKSKICKCHSEMSRTCRKNVWTVLCQTVKRIMWFSIKLRDDKQHKSNWAPSNWENLAKRSFCNYVHSACRLVIIELMQQCQEMNLAQMTRTCERIPQKRHLSCKGIARDLRIYSGLIFDLVI